jgi:hypothetical protein
MKIITGVTIIITLLVMGCKNKDDLPRKPNPDSHGTITYSDVKNSPNTTTVSTQSNVKTLDVYTTICAPIGDLMQTRIYAWNGYYGGEFRALEFIIAGSFDNFPLNHPGVSVTYYKGLMTQKFSLSGYSYEGKIISQEDYIPTFNFPQGDYLVKATANVPINFSEFDINKPADQRRIKATIPQMVIGVDTLLAMDISINSFGGAPFPYNHHMTFDLDGKPCGSYDLPLYNCVKPEPNAPGILQLKGTFIGDSRNPLVDLTFDFTHHSSKLAYTGPVGKYDLSDGTGYTEIKITATDQSGKIYREQKGSGFVRTYFEQPWYKFFDGATFNYREGYIVLAFEAELQSDDGATISIENGNAFYKLRWD